jgi:hypothetical protein
MSVKDVKTPLETKKKDVVKELLDNVLDFGPDSRHDSDASERLKDLVKQLEDLNARIKKLSSSQL